MTMENETPADRLREAAGLVRQGHARGRLIDREGKRCAVGAICRVQEVDNFADIGKLMDADEVGKAAIDVLHDVLPPVEQDGAHLSASSFKSTHVTVWNDYHAADGAHVAAMMEKAAARYEETH